MCDVINHVAPQERANMTTEPHDLTDADLEAVTAGKTYDGPGGSQTPRDNRNRNPPWNRTRL